MASFNGVPVPSNGQKVEYSNGKYSVPDHPIVPFIEGDGTGRDIWKASVRVFDAAVEKAYQGKRSVAWYEVFAGEKAKARFQNWLPDDTISAMREFRVAIKGPLTTPIGGGIRSLNVALRQILDLYCCVRPVKYYAGVPSPVKHPERMNIVIFRENTEDVYAGIEWEEGTPDAARLIEFLNKDMLKGGKKQIRLDSGIGIKPMSVTGTKRLVRMAIQHALEHKNKAVTLVHKGNIQKFTEGAFRKWGYELATEEFRDQVVTERESWIIDDSYNANPNSVRAGLDVLRSLAGVKWLVFGDMGELGAHREASHADIGRYARACGVERLFALGSLTPRTVESFGSGAEWFADAEMLVRRIEAELRPGVTVLIKGSRVNRLERVVQALIKPTPGETALNHHSAAS